MRGLGARRSGEGRSIFTFLSDDLDRLPGFYERVRGGLSPHLREGGPTTVLHPFQILDGPTLPPAPGMMFERGRLDRFALLAPSGEAFREIHRRLEREPRPPEPSCTGKAWIMDFHDPDEFYVEVDLAQARRAGRRNASTWKAAARGDGQPIRAARAAAEPMW